MDSKTELTGLKKYTNYTVTVLAFTNGGDGVKSQVHTAVTEQDVPGPPSSVKALAMSQDSILVSILSGRDKEHKDRSLPNS